MLHLSEEDLLYFRDQRQIRNQRRKLLQKIKKLHKNLLKILSNGAIAGIIGIVLAHIIADFIAALADPDLKSAAYGIVIGGFIPLLAVPFLEKYVTKSRYHTVVGDHEDLKKDLKRKHK